VIEMHVAPHFTTLQKATQRLLRSQHFFAKLLDATIARIMKRVKTAAADSNSTGFNISHASRYYVWRSKRMGMSLRRRPLPGLSGASIGDPARTTINRQQTKNGQMWLLMARG
jgi:hypothetical protein